MLKTVIKQNKTFETLVRKIDTRYRLILSSISPELASKILYKRAFGKKLDLKNPKTFNEKLMWLKLNIYYNNSLITKCADKYKVREYIEECGCSEILNDLIGSWDSVDEIEWNSLPNKFVLKCNHGCGYNIICNNKEKFDIHDAKEKLRKWMKEDYWKFHAEVNYKYIEKKIICEKYIETDDGLLPNDYKVFCFNGEPKFILAINERETGHHQRYFFDLNWNELDFEKEKNRRKNQNKPRKPNSLDQMIYYSEKISKGFPFVRVDFYDSGNKPIFGEMTFTPVGGLATYYKGEVAIMLGDWIDLPKSYKSDLEEEKNG